MIKKLLSLMLALLMILSVMILPVSAAGEELLEAVTLDAIAMAPIADGDRFLGGSVNLDFDGVTFSSSNEDVINSSTGAVTRPSAETDVTLTATATGGATETFTLKVPSADSDYPVETPVYFDNFEDGILDSRIKKSTYSQETLEDGGVLNFTSTSSMGAGEQSVGTVYIKEDESAVSGKFKVTFELNRDAYVYGTTRIYFSGPNGYCFYIDWCGVNYSTWMTQIRLTTFAGNGASVPDDVQDMNGFTHKLKVEAEIDGESGKIKLFLNGEQFPLNNGGYLRGGTSVSNISIVNYHSSSDILMPYFACHSLSYNDEDKAVCKADFEALTKSGLLKAPMVGDYLIDPLSLPTVGANGSDIAWTSSHPSVIATDGWVARPESDTEVTLGATVSYGNAAPMSTSFTFMVPGKSTQVEDMPKPVELIHSDNFDDEEADEDHITLGGTAVEEDGVLHLAGASGENASAYVYAKDDKSAVSGKTVVEFLLTRQNMGTTSAMLFGTGSGAASHVLQINWWPTSNGNYVNLQFPNTPGGDIASHTFPLASIDAINRLKVMALIDSATGTLSVWLNNKFAANGYTCGASDFVGISFYNNNAPFDLSLDDFRCYSADYTLSDDSCIITDLGNLNQNNFYKAPLVGSYLVDSLALPTSGSNGTTISWSSSHPAVIAADGWMTRPESDTTVTMTATVSKGSATPKTKPFTFTVPGKSTEVSDLPLPGNMVFYDSFNDNSAGSNVELNPGTGSAAEADGVLNIAGASGQSASAKVFAKADQSIVEGKVVVEFIMTRKAQGTTTAMVFGENVGVSGNVLQVNWWDSGNNIVNLQFPNTLNGELAGHTFALTDIGAQTRLKVTAYIDTTTNRLSVWLNNKFAANGYTCGAKGVSGVTFYNNAAPFDLSVDDFRVYNATIPSNAEQNVAADLATITEASILKAPLADGKLIDSLNLKKNGENGCAIVWSSTNTSVIDTDGNVYRAKEDTTVTVTASVSYMGEGTQTKSFTYTVAGLHSQPVGMPKLTSLVSLENFDDEIVNEKRIVLTDGNGMAREQGGTLNIIKPSATGTTSGRIYLNSEQTDMEGNLVNEFIMTRKTDAVFSAQFTSGPGLFLIVDWWPNSTGINVQYADSKTESYTNHFLNTAEYGAQNRLKVTVLLQKDGTFSLWLNNKPAVENGYSYGSSVLGAVYFYNGGSACNASVDDFRVYYAQDDDATAVSKDIEKLDAFFTPGELTDGVLYKSVSLPTEGVHGSKITWSSTNSSLLDIDGTLRRPAEDDFDTDPSVTITVVVESGEEKATKEFTFTVLRTGSGDRVIAEADAKELTLEALLSKPELVGGYINQDLVLPADGKFGSRITWFSSNTDLIADNGSIVMIPETGADSPEVIMNARIEYGLVTITKQIPVRVMPSEADATLRRGLPPVYETFQEEPFDNDFNQTKYAWSLRPYGNGVAKPVDGKMQISRRENQGANYITHVEIAAHESTNAQEGLVAFDFIWERDLADHGDAYLKVNTGDGMLTQMDWTSDNKITISYAGSLGGGTQTVTVGPIEDGKVRVTGRIDSNTDTWTLWLDEVIVIKDQYPVSGVAAGLRQFFFGIAGNNFIDMYIDDLHCYFARPYSYEQPFMDSKKLTDDIIVPNGFKKPETIASDLNLITEGYYGSEISWSSSHPEIIEPNGKVNRPENTTEAPLVTLTATLSKDGYAFKKEFSYYVLPTFTDDASFVQADLDYLTFENYGIFAFGDNSLDAVRYSLNLPSELLYSSKIMWSTSNDKVVTTSGRVIRGRWDGAPQQVTLTATVSYGSATMTKDFVITVLPDEELKDPQYMPDEEFFGEWDGTSWIQPGKFDYAANPKMAAVEAAAKAGDYETAKVELLTYLRGRPASVLNTGRTSRNTDYVDTIAMNSIWHYQSDRWLMGSTTVRNHDWQQIEIPIRSTSTIGAKLAYNIESKYREASSVTIASKEHPNAEWHPKLRVVANGQIYMFDAIADATSRSGQYDFTNFGLEETLKVKLFGELQGDDTIISTVMFDTNSVPGGVESATLILTMKLDQDYVESKDIILYEEPNVGWTDADLTYGRTSKFYHNLNGIPGDMDWLNRHSTKFNDSEYQQTHRFQNFGEVLTEYEYTGDEKYAYKMLYTMMDYIIDSQFTMSLSEYWKYNEGYCWSDYWELDIDNGGYTKRRGGMPQLLTTSIRLTTWIPIYEALLDSPYMTPDVCTTILKNFWDCSYEGDRYLVDYALGKMGDTPTAHNQWVIEANNVSKVALCFPEFSAGETWMDNMLRVLEHVKLGGYAQDGGYGEAVQGYSELVLNQYLDYVIMMHKAGRTLPADFEEFLYNSTIYCIMQSRDASGVAMSWGDAGWSKSLGRIMPLYEQLNPEEEYLFISSRGALGVEPDWQSIHYPSVRVTVMQSDWGTNALHGFMDNNGVAGHGHPDDNALRVTAYGEYLLIDPGVFSYDDTIYRRYGISTLAHNTVEVDSQSQRFATDGIYVLEGNEQFPAFTLPGSVHEWSTNDQFDVISQTSEGYSQDFYPNDLTIPGVDHRRTVTFLKSGFWIVSDLMLPQNNEPHSYKQLWHFLPKAGLSVNPRTGNMGTNQLGVNITISSPDGVATNSPTYDELNPTQEMGWFSRRWGTADYAPYGYYAKTDVTGNAGFDTLLFPYPTQGQGAAETEDIDLGVPVDVATAMKMTTTMDGRTSKTQYMLQYEPTMGTTRTFGDYAGDGFVNVVRTDEEGNIQELILNQGSVLKRADGTVLLSIDTDVPVNVGVEIRGNTAIVSTNSSQSTGDITINPEDITFYADAGIDNVKINDTYYEFNDNDGEISVESGETDEVLNNDPSNDHGGITGTENGNQGGESGSGNEGGSSGIGGGAGGLGGGGGALIPDKGFSDTQGHWAEESIDRMAEKGIVKGDNGSFRPDASITRAELITMVARALNLTADGANTGFSDVAADSWYASYIKAALDKGIISKDTVFRPNDLVTREEMAKILSGADAIRRGETFAAPEGDLSFVDNSAISRWAKPFVLYANKNGLMNGMEDGVFAPKANGTRAQVATVLDRMFKEN